MTSKSLFAKSRPPVSLSTMPPYHFVVWRLGFHSCVVGYSRDLGNLPTPVRLSARRPPAAQPYQSIHIMMTAGSGCWLNSFSRSVEMPGCLLMSVVAPWMALPIILPACLHTTRSGLLQDVLVAPSFWTAAAVYALTVFNFVHSCFC